MQEDCDLRKNKQLMTLVNYITNYGNLHEQENVFGVE